MDTELRVTGPRRARPRALQFERAMQIDESVYGPNHPNVAGRAMQLGNVLRAMQDNEGAQVLFDRATRIMASTSELQPSSA